MTGGSREDSTPRERALARSLFVMDSRELRQTFSHRDLDDFPRAAALPPSRWRAMKVVAQVLPFRVNRYVVDHLIDWRAVPEDPIFQLTFPQPGMLSAPHFARMERAMRGSAAEARDVANQIRAELNPHPADQLSRNVPRVGGAVVPGVQRKYRETCLIFPRQGQTCHAYCSYCFRWPQFIGEPDLKLATDEARSFARFIAAETDLTDVLITGGDPLVMKTAVLARYIEPLLGPGFEHITNIRIGTKSVSYFPHRFVSDGDADALLALFERVIAAGKHLAVMAHYNHPNELATDVARQAAARIRATGAEIRTQSPVIRHVNDTPEIWADLWRAQVALGMIPYYMFVARDTGARHYFELPLARTLAIYRGAYQRVSGLARTARGPSMSASPGKVAIDGVSEIAGERVFVLSFLQARDPDWVKRPFFARYDPEATWLDQLVPAGGERFFWQSPPLERARRVVSERLPAAQPDGRSADLA